MDGCPLDDEAVGSRRPVAVGNCEGVDFCGCFELCVFGVEMRWWVIVEMHLDHDAEEARSGIPCERAVREPPLRRVPLRTARTAKGTGDLEGRPYGFPLSRG